MSETVNLYLADFLSVEHVSLVQISTCETKVESWVWIYDDSAVMVANKIFRNAAPHESLLLLCTVCKIWKVADLLQRARSVLSHSETGTGIIDLFWSLLSGVFSLWLSKHIEGRTDGWKT